MMWKRGFAAGNFGAGMPLGKRLELYDQLMEQLGKLGISDEQRRRATTEWRRGIHVIYQRIIARIPQAQGKPRLQPVELQTLRNEFNALLDFQELGCSSTH
jgi:hypothetical protein